MAVLNFRSRSRLVNEFNRALRHSLPYVGGRESCVSCANPNVGMRSTFQLSLRQGIAGARQSWLRLSGQRPAEFKWVSTGYAERGALRFCSGVGRTYVTLRCSRPLTTAVELKWTRAAGPFEAVS